MRKRLSNEEINKLAEKYLRLKEEAEESEEKKIEFSEFQNYCFNKLAFLVEKRAAKYKKFSNYLDLKQDGFEAMLHALRTYKPGKGNFSIWADMYIKTKISRCANAHSTIKYPIKKTAEMKPYKVGTVPLVIDSSSDQFDCFYESENREMISNIINNLPEEHQNIIKKYYGFVGKKSASMAAIMDEMSLSRPQLLKIIEEAKNKIKKTLSED